MSEQTDPRQELYEDYLHQLFNGTAPPPEEYARRHGLDANTYVRAHADFHALHQTLGDKSLGFKPDQILDDYRLIRELGRGGMGTVWEAEQQSLSRSVALKLLPFHAGNTQKNLERFEREAKAGGRLTHSGIVATYGSGHFRDIHYIVQELVPHGRTLAHYLTDLRQNRTFQAEFYATMAQLFLEVAKAIHFAHENGVIHRDIKPGNILMTPQGHPKVGDFGLARLEDPLRISRTEDTLGTPYYMAPEQANARIGTVGPLSDVFSLGATLYEALTLIRPFEGDSAAQVLHKLLYEEPIDPRRIRSKIPKDLVVICMKCMEKRPEKRYSSMAAVAEDLQRYLDDKPILAKAPGVGTRLVKWSRRHPVIFISSLLLTTGLTVVTGMYLQLQKTNKKNSQLITALTQSEQETAQKAKEAQERARTSQKVRDYLVSMFHEANPLATAFGWKTSAKELLDRGKENIDLLDSEPGVQADLLWTLGKAYSGGRQPTQALTLYERAMDQILVSYSTEQTERYRFLLDLGSVQLDLQQHEKAEENLQTALKGITRLTGPHSEDTYRAHTNLGFGYLVTQQDELAEEQFNLVIEAAENGHPVRFNDVAICKIRLSHIFQQRHDFTEAEQLLTEVLETDRQVYGDSGTRPLMVQELLATIYTQTNRPDEALKLLDDCIEKTLAKWGPNHMLTISPRFARIVVRLQMGELESLVPEVEHLLPITEKTAGKTATITLSMRAHLAEMYTKVSRFDEARQLFETNLNLLPESDRARSVSGFRSRLGLARIHWRTDELKLAEERYMEAYRSVIEKWGPGHYWETEVVNQIVDFYSQTEQTGKAIRLVEEALTHFPEGSREYDSLAALETSLKLSLEAQ